MTPAEARKLAGGERVRVYASKDTDRTSETFRWEIGTVDGVNCYPFNGKPKAYITVRFDTNDPGNKLLFEEIEAERCELVDAKPAKLPRCLADDPIYWRGHPLHDYIHTAPDDELRQMHAQSVDMIQTCFNLNEPDDAHHRIIEAVEREIERRRPK